VAVMERKHQGLALAGLVVLTCGVTAACGSRAGTAEVTASVVPTTSVSVAATSTATATSSATTSDGSPTLRTVTAEPLPGEAIDAGPKAGQALAVVGVEAGHALVVRRLPGPASEAVTTLGAVATGAVSTGRSRLVGATIWDEVAVHGTTGWAEGSHLALPAHTTDLTAEAVAKLGRRPAAATMRALGSAVAGAYTSTEPPSIVVVTVDSSVGDLGEITMDVVGLGDDSVAAIRLHVFGAPTSGSFTLKSVEGTPFCYRGVSAAGRCV
jgi:hypothetical protein